MWMEEYEKLSDWEKEEFTKITNLLLSKTFVLRYKVNAKERLSKSNYDYTFIERHILLFKEYFRMSGWELKANANYGVVSIFNRFDTNRLKLGKDTTYILYALRLIYEEEREKLTLSHNIMVSVDDIIEKMKNLNLIEKKPADRILIDSFSMLKNHSVIDKIDGDWNEPGTTVVIYPSLLFVVTDDKLVEIHELIKKRKEENLFSEDDEDAGEVI